MKNDEKCLMPEKTIIATASEDQIQTSEGDFNDKFKQLGTVYLG